MESAHAALCPHCGATLPAGAFFCGRCGAGQPGTAAERYDIFTYDAAYARQRGACVTFGRLLGRGLAYVLCPLVLLFFGDGWMLAGLLLSFAGVAALVVDTCLSRRYFLARQSAVVRERGSDTLYYVTLTGDTDVGFDAATRAAAAAHNLENARRQGRLARIGAVIVSEVERYRRGENRYNIWTGGDVRVTELRRPFVLRTARRYTLYAYETADGRQRRFRLPACFPGLAEDGASTVPPAPAAGASAPAGTEGGARPDAGYQAAGTPGGAPDAAAAAAFAEAYAGDGADCCPGCEAPVPPDADFCPRCGFDLRTCRAQQRLLETDPALTALNARYARQYVWRLWSAIATAATLALLVQGLEGNVPDELAIPALLLFPPSLVVCIVFCCLRGATHKRIARLLDEKTRPPATGPANMPDRH